MSSYRKPKRKNWYKTLVFIALYLAFLALTAIYRLLSYWYVWMVLAAGGLATLVFWHAKSTACRCPICGCEFEIQAKIACELEPQSFENQFGVMFWDNPRLERHEAWMIKRCLKDEDYRQRILNLIDKWLKSYFSEKKRFGGTES